jgi:hypothetical protein
MDFAGGMGHGQPRGPVISAAPSAAPLRPPDAPSPPPPPPALWSLLPAAPGLAPATPPLAPLPHAAACLTGPAARGAAGAGAAPDPQTDEFMIQ